MINKFVGQGLVFPLELTAQGSIELKSGPELINSSLRILLTWSPKTRFFLAEFGVNIHDFLLEPNTENNQKAITAFIYRATDTWETRITILSITYTPFTNRGGLNLSMRYIINSTRTEALFVHPFYSEITT